MTTIDMYSDARDPSESKIGRQSKTEAPCAFAPARCRGMPPAYRPQARGLAAGEFQKVLDHSGVGAGFVTGALAKLQLARAQVLTHDTKAARKSYEDFLALWKNADPDLPIYKEAKAEYAVLRKTVQ